ncbi:DUF6796 family protein [Tannerella forsythia]|uniref:DUF998 domain-containing protein n=1 Tax=Tannerella forsythia TaxID=28112 RepID=A0A3P1XMB0_TANFO|nr:DUF6796 family protein [Tannerella forsythia]RRD59198.1 hypothetical protein EII40_10915 [Tannerella forsythia]
MDKRIKLTGYIGIAASLLMFAGDMLLYFTTENFTGRHNELLLSMGNVSFGRLVAGGLLGPLAAVLYVIGFYHLYLLIKDVWRKTAGLMFACFSVSMMIGGAFHAFFPAFGIVSSQGHPEMIAPLLSYAEWLGGSTFVLMGTGWLLFCVSVLQKQTALPRWIVVATPLITLWLNYLWHMLPQPWNCLIAGGWNNLVCTLFFAASLLSLKKSIK